MIKAVKRIKQLLFGICIKGKAAAVGKNLKVNNKSKVTSNTYLGNNVNFNGMKITGQGKVVIGNNFHSGTDCLIISQNHNYEGEKIPYDETYICKEIVIEDNVWIGDRVIILAGSKIEEGSIIQAGSVVAGTVPKYSIAGGHPAKPFKQRNIEHYEELKRKGAYH